MRRRSFLATMTTLALPLAGCVRPDYGSLTMASMASDAAIARRHAEDLDALPPDSRALVRDAIDGETPTRADTGPPFDADRPFEDDGAFYDIGYEVVERRSATQYDLQIDYDPVAEPSSVVAYADLPAVDRRALSRLLPPPAEPPTGRGFDVDVADTYLDDTESVLVPEPEYEAVSYDGTAYRVGVGGSREIEVDRYQYSADRIADSPAAFGRQLRERYLFTLSGLPEAEREIVLAAADEGYYPDSPNRAFRSLTERLGSHEPVRSTADTGHWLVRYDGRIYWAELSTPGETMP
ncbi:hypothetical protein ACAH01_14800 [Halomicrobium sp. HM KBTZ05]|uniref:hypothetical protein n=1 Tax=Halomicrobium sp. HM KBTZ05 TaxID=3242663 RepID=UPI003557E9E0